MRTLLVCSSIGAEKSAGEQLDKDKIFFRTFDANLDGVLDPEEQRRMVFLIHIYCTLVIYFTIWI